MNFPDINHLNGQFGAPGKIVFRSDKTGLPVVSMISSHGSCEISLYGGHVLSYRPTGHLPVLFVSKASLFEPGKPIRGGIPICWPWFGANAANSDLPLHGFARLSLWKTSAVEYTATYSSITLTLNDSAYTRQWWPHAFQLTLRITLSDTLKLELTTTNNSSTPITITEALHTYYMVRNIADITVHGLEGVPYRDKAAGVTGHSEQSPISVRAETDRVYENTAAPCVIRDTAIGREITIVKQGSNSTIVWNPWDEKARRMPDFGDDEYLRMICVETANAGVNAVTLGPTAKHTVGVTIAVALTQ